MVEFALVFGFLMTLALGAFEYGMAFRDWLSVTISSREGGRVAASAANYGDADCVILEAATGALQSLTSGEVSEVSPPMMVVASSLPSSTPHWSNELIPQITPWVKTLCSYKATS